LLSADKNSMYECVRVRSSKNPCVDCRRLEGQVHRLAAWSTRGLMMGSVGQRTECGGWECNHTLKKTKARARGDWTRSMMLGWEEGKHPRDPDGKFGAGGGGGGEGDDGGGDGDSGGKYQAAVGKDPEFTKKWNEKLTDIKKEPGPPPGESVIASTNYYTDEGYHKINGALRGTSDEILDQKTIESIQHMDNLCNRKMLDRDIKTFRSDDGAGLPNGGNLSEAQFKKLKGSSFTDRGFTSTATDTSLGDTFGDVKYEYRIPKGSRGAYVDSISKWPDEREFVLGRGTTSTIVDAKIVDGRRTLVLEVQP